MAGRGDGQELSDTFDHAEKNRSEVRHAGVLDGN
jgi:hypothetical protein